MGNEFQAMYSMPLLIIFAFELISLGMGVFVVAKYQLDIFQTVFSASYLMVALTKLYFVCRAGDHITFEVAFN